MPNLRLLALLFAGLLGALDDVSSASAQSKAAPSEAAPTASPKTAPAENKPPEMPDIIFYVAKGEANACGPSCDEWIAAGRYEVEVGTERIPARVSLRAFYDPAAERVRV